MAKPELFLHVGTHKTGTTAIQAHLAAHRAALAAQGVLYPHPRLGTWKSIAGHHSWAHAMARDRWIDRLRCSLFGHRVRHAARGMRATVLSAEPIYRHILGRARRDRPQDWFAAHRAYLARLAAWADGFSLRPVVYFRPPDDMAVSLFKEHVMRRIGSSGRQGLADFVLRLGTTFDYADHVAALEAELGPTEVRDYNAARRRGLEADFLDLVGASGLPAPDRVSVRGSPGNRAALWLAGLPETLAPRDYGRRALFALRAGPGGPFDEDGPTTLWPDRATFDAFVDRHRAAYALPFLSEPAWPDLPSAAWTDADTAWADAAFRDWEAAHAGLLQRRESAGLAFYHPDPA